MNNRTNSATLTQNLHAALELLVAQLWSEALNGDSAVEGQLAEAVTLVQSWLAVDVKTVPTEEAFGSRCHFGVCPVCGTNNGYMDIGRGHWFLCRRHQLAHFAGSNLLSSWRHTPQAEQLQNAARLEQMAIVTFW